MQIIVSKGQLTQDEEEERGVESADWEARCVEAIVDISWTVLE